MAINTNNAIENFLVHRHVHVCFNETWTEMNCFVPRILRIGSGLLDDNYCLQIMATIENFATHPHLHVGIKQRGK